MTVKYNKIILLTFVCLTLQGFGFAQAQDSNTPYGYHPGIEQLSPEDQQYMQEMMKHFQDPENMDENAMFGAIMSAAESMPSQCRDIESEVADAKTSNMQDIQNRNDFNYWFNLTQNLTPEKINMAEYKKEWENCQSMATSSLSDIICHYQMQNFYMPQFLAIAENYDALDEEKLNPIQEKYERECSQNDLDVTRALSVDKPRRGDSLLVTKAGSYLLGERDGLIFGNNFPEESKSGKSYFQQVK